jgi:lipopolysaccharide transport system ATP-binding protein
MPLPIISVENLSKRYVVGHRKDRREHIALRDVLAQEMRNATRKAVDVFRGRQVVQGDTLEEFWALRDVNFEVQQGEVLGIIGRNGAGKSTLLKILGRITEPTKGRVTLRGRVASLLEVGTGFHPELSGRENIYLNGAILGMSRAEIRKKFDEIVSFAEVERFLDTPVKRYSSGMYVRLAFAVAAHLEPEILIVDEVLAVGDTDFQKKCLGKMDEVSRRQGRTVLFVSHNMAAISSLCTTAIWIDNGLMHDRGPARELTSRYLAHSQRNAARVVKLGALPRPGGVSDARLRIEELEWISHWPLRQGDPAKARLTLLVREPISDVAVGILFRNLEGSQVLECCSDLIEKERRRLSSPGRHSVTLEIKHFPLAPDTYTLDIGCRSGDVYALDYIPLCAHIEVVPGPNTLVHTIGRGAGVQLPADWSWDDVPAQGHMIPERAL